MNEYEESMLSHDLRELHVVMSDIRAYQQKQSSLRWNFWRGIFYGFGFFIGSAILVSLLVYLLNHIGASDNSFAGRFLKKVIELFQQSRR